MGGVTATHLDALARGWAKAFEKAQSALRAAGPYLSGKELGERTRRLTEERSDVARLLERLVRDLQADSGFVRRLAAPTHLQVVNGIPAPALEAHSHPARDRRRR